MVQLVTELQKVVVQLVTELQKVLVQPRIARLGRLASGGSLGAARLG